MINLFKILKYWRHLPKSIYWNYKIFSFKDALKLPILFNNHCKVKINGDIRIQGEAHFGMVRIGFTQSDFFIDDMNKSLFFVEEGQCLFSKNTNIGCGCHISVKDGGILKFGENFWSTGPIFLICRNEMSFGKNNALAWNITILDHNPHPINGLTKKDVNISDNCWLSFNTTILPGVKLSEGTCVACNSTVIKSFEEENILLGGINTILKTDIIWK